MTIIVIKYVTEGLTGSIFFLVRMFLTLAEKILLFVPASRALNRNEGNELLNNWLSRLCHSFHRPPFQTSSKQSPASFIAFVFV